MNVLPTDALLVVTSDGHILKVDNELTGPFGSLKQYAQSEIRRKRFVIPPFLLNGVSHAVLQLALRWCRFHAEDEQSETVDPKAVVSMDPRSNRYHRIELSEWEAKFLETNKAHLWELAVAAECLGASGLRLASLMLIAEVAEKEDAWTLSYIFGVFNESLSQPRHHQNETKIQIKLCGGESDKLLLDMFRFLSYSEMRKCGALDDRWNDLIKKQRSDLPLEEVDCVSYLDERARKVRLTDIPRLMPHGPQQWRRSLSNLLGSRLAQKGLNVQRLHSPFYRQLSRCARDRRPLRCHFDNAGSTYVQLIDNMKDINKFNVDSFKIHRFDVVHDIVENFMRKNGPQIRLRAIENVEFSTTDHLAFRNQLKCFSKFLRRIDLLRRVDVHLFYPWQLEAIAQYDLLNFPEGLTLFMDYSPSTDNDNAAVSAEGLVNFVSHIGRKSSSGHNDFRFQRVSCDYVELLNGLAEWAARDDPPETRIALLFDGPFQVQQMDDQWAKEQGFRVLEQGKQYRRISGDGLCVTVDARNAERLDVEIA